MPDPHPSSPSGLLWVLVPVGAALVVAGMGAFWWASQRNPGSPQTGRFETVTVTSQTCDPMEMTVAAGRRSFEITNASDRPVEWEILDGVMVVAERENILPGYKSVLNVNLSPGDFAITCGLLTNPRGVLHVTHSEEWSTEAAQVELRDFLGPLGEYKVYLIMQGAQAVSTAEALRDAIVADDLAAAQAAWIAARAPYKRIEPLAYRLSDLENTIDPLANLLAAREADPAFTGYHRLEYGLFAQGTLDGLAPVADRLVADLTDLKARLSGFTIDPALLIALPGDMASQLAEGRIVQGEDHYAGADLADFAASLEGIAKLSGLLEGVVAPVDPALKDALAAQIAATQAALDGLKQEGSFPAYDKVGEKDRKALAKAFADLAGTLDRLQPAIGGI
ncbi:iron uptake system protein EfeO [Paracoccus sp. (in: a-proteobacteria)]|uniref:iron uptake system protein EfeO n=1 Tax=Paracoccus sp. TaxID=267 RepID=UPI003A858FFB